MFPTSCSHACAGHVNEHFVNGMVGAYTIEGEREENWAEPEDGNTVQEYNLAAELVEW